MKKFYKISAAAVVFSIMITAALCAGGSKELTEAEKKDGWRDFKAIGFKLHRPAFFDKYPDNFDYDSEGEEDKKEDEVLYAGYTYYFVSDEVNAAYDAIVQDANLTREEQNKKIQEEVLSAFKSIYTLYTFRTPLMGDKKIEELTGYPFNEVIRKTKNFTQVFAVADFSSEGLTEKSAKIYEEMILQAKDAIPTVTCSDPVSNESLMISKLKRITFDTIDLDGNKITSDIFNNYDVTMVNLWATWCGPCKAELPEIAKLYEAFKEKGCNIIGIAGDVTVDNKSKIETAKSIISKAECNYTVVQNNDSLKSVFKYLRAWPTTIFVDKKGNIIASSVNDIIVGSRNLEQFTEAMEKALKTVKK